MIGDLLAAIGVVEPAPPEPSPHTGWPLLAITTDGESLMSYPQVIEGDWCGEYASTEEMEE